VRNPLCTQGGSGDAKALDTWPLYPGNSLQTSLQIVPAQLIIRKTTTSDGGGPFAYTVPSSAGTPTLAPGVSLHQTATTTAPDTPTLAAGDDLTQLALGTYTISEQQPDGTWAPQSLTCDDRAGD